jgi:phosphohistidine swiveling domain-containing protein
VLLMSYLHSFCSPIRPDRAYKGYERAAVGAVLGLALLAGGCSGDENDAEHKKLLPPSSASVQTARQLEKEYPGLRAFVSQTTGELLWIDSGRTPLTPPSDPLNPQTALAAVRNWMGTHPDTYRIASPQTALDALPGAFDPLSRTLRFEQYQKGIPVQGKYGLARFSPRGELISLVTRLLPDQNFQTQASPAAVQAGRIAVQSWVYYREQAGAHLLGGEEMVKEVQGLIAAGFQQRQSIKGRTAFPGKVTGRVCLVRGKADLPRVQLGDVLVAKTTMPDYTPAMKLAAAFVTEEGGITSHAAIISREWKKPCVVGTGNCTKLLQDGDVVEVDAEQGIVRKI